MNEHTRMSKYDDTNETNVPGDEILIGRLIDGEAMTSDQKRCIGLEWRRST